MTKKSKVRTPEFKMDIAVEALKGENTIVEISQKHGVHPRQVRTWRDQLLDEGAAIFSSKHALRKTKKDLEKDDLQKKVGELTMHIEYLKKKLGD